MNGKKYWDIKVIFSTFKGFYQQISPLKKGMLFFVHRAMICIANVAVEDENKTNQKIL